MALGPFLLLLWFIPAWGLKAQVGDVDLDSSEDELSPFPSVVIGGIGDSGTTGVTEALHSLGLRHCMKRDAFGEPPWGHKKRYTYITQLLLGSGGVMSRAAYLRNAPAFWKTHDWLKKISRKDYKCIMDKADKTEHIEDRQQLIWGFKEPHYAWLLPVLDEAFRNETKYLVVARDPRDICTNAMQDQFMHYGRALGQPDCYKWWSSFWRNILDAYEHEPRFGIVRIEDLVVPDPHTSSKPIDTLRCMLDHVGMKPEWSQMVQAVKFLQDREVLTRDTSLSGEDLLKLYSNPPKPALEEDEEFLRLYSNPPKLAVEEDDEDDDGEYTYLPQSPEKEAKEKVNLGPDPQRVSKEDAEKELDVFHEHRDAYMGHHNQQTAWDRGMIKMGVSARFDIPKVHDTMRRLGYDILEFKLATPTSPAVLCRR